MSIDVFLFLIITEKPQKIVEDWENKVKRIYTYEYDHVSQSAAHLCP